MRARQKKRQQTRRLTIIITVVIIAVSIAVGIYFVSTANGSSPLDKYDRTLVSTTDLASLQSVSDQPYGAAAPTSMQTVVTHYGGTSYVSNGKPIVVFVGGEFCPYCAVERWSLIMALERFGNFTGLRYTTSANDEGDYASFTFVGSSYTSSYIAFRPYEAEDRSGSPLQTVPANYSSVWSSFGDGFPFLNLGNTYVVKESILAFPDIIAGKNWTAILEDIKTSDSVGLQFREGANLITGVICKLTGGAPVAVSGPTQSSLAVAGSPVSNALVQTPSWSPAFRRSG